VNLPIPEFIKRMVENKVHVQGSVVSLREVATKETVVRDPGVRIEFANISGIVEFVEMFDE